MVGGDGGAVRGGGGHRHHPLLRVRDPLAADDGPLGDVFGIGFGIEAWAFFLEAIFIGIYLYGWQRLPPRVHYRLGWVLPPAGVLGAFGVIIANSWMNTPGGFQLGANGRLVNVSVVGAIFTPALGYEFWHLIVAPYMTAGFIVASVYAVGWLRGRRDHYHRLGFTVPFTMGAVLAPIQLVIGEVATRAVFHDQPAKFAAMEITWNTQSHNPEVLGGVLRGDGMVQLGPSIPSLDSMLAGFSPTTVVRGLASFSPDYRPTVVDANVVHLAFDVMVGLGSVACLLTLWYAVAWFRYRDLPRSRWFFRGAALAGVVGVGSFVFAWGFGQVPYLLPGRLTIQQAAGAPAIEVLLLAITVVALLLVVPSLLLLYMLDQRSALES